MSMNVVCLDEGASSSRYAVNSGAVKVYPNNARLIEEDTVVSLVPNSDDVLDNLDITITKTSEESRYFPQRVLLGSLAERFSRSNTRPSMNANKCRQKLTYITVLLGTALGCLDAGIGGEEVSLIMNLPPVELTDDNVNYVKSELLGAFSVKFHKLEKEISFTVTDVVVKPEGVSASVAFFYNKDASPRVTMADYSTGYVLVVDIGASTSDLALLKDKKFIERTGQTYKLGGNTLRDKVRSKIKEVSGLEVTDEAVETLLSEGRLPYGNSYRDMSKELVAAKREFADELYDSIDSYFTTVGVGISSIKAVFVCGGGSMESSYFDEKENKEVKTSEPVSKYLLERLQEVCDSVDVVSYPDGNPRMANIIGTILIGNAYRAKKAQKKA